MSDQLDVALVIDQLRDANPAIRNVAAERLRGESLARTEVLRQLNELLFREDNLEIARSIEELLMVLDDRAAAARTVDFCREQRSSRARAHVLRAQGAAAVRNEARDLFRRLQQKRPVIFQLFYLVHVNPELVPYAIAALQTDRRVRTTVGLMLNWIAETRPEIVADLRRLLMDSSPKVRDIAAEILGGMGKHASVAVPDLVEALALNPTETSAVFEALLSIGADADDCDVVVSAVVALVRKRADRHVVAALLGEIAKDNPAVIAQLSLLLRDEETPVREAALRALLRARREAVSASQAVAQLLKDGNVTLRRLASVFLVLTVKEADENSTQLRAWLQTAVPDLLIAVADEDEEISVRSMACLGRLGAWEAIPTIRQRLTHPSRFVRENAIDALRQLGVDKHGKG